MFKHHNCAQGSRMSRKWPAVSAFYLPIPQSDHRVWPQLWRKLTGQSTESLCRVMVWEGATTSVATSHCNEIHSQVIKENKAVLWDSEGFYYLCWISALGSRPITPNCSRRTEPVKSFSFYWAHFVCLWSCFPPWWSISKWNLKSPVEPLSWTLLLIIVCDGVFTWTRLVSAVPGSSAGPPSWLSPPRVDDVSPPVLCVGPPGSFSFARDASGAAGTQEDKHRLIRHLQRNTNW